MITLHGFAWKFASMPEAKTAWRTLEKEFGGENIELSSYNILDPEGRFVVVTLTTDASLVKRVSEAGKGWEQTTLDDAVAKTLWERRIKGMIARGGTPNSAENVFEILTADG